jgi:hypothetical protein
MALLLDLYKLLHGVAEVDTKLWFLVEHRWAFWKIHRQNLELALLRKIADAVSNNGFGLRRNIVLL